MQNTGRVEQKRYVEVVRSIGAVNGIHYFSSTRLFLIGSRQAQEVQLVVARDGGALCQHHCHRIAEERPGGAGHHKAVPQGMEDHRAGGASI